MDIFVDYIFPIITSLAAAVFSWLFTMLHYKRVLKDEEKIRKEEREERERDRRQAKWDKDKIQNEVVFKNRPQVRIVEEADNIVGSLKIRLLPYINMKLNSLSEDDANNISFDYSDEIYSEDYWDNYEFVIKNIGKSKIDTGYLMVPYKSNVNMYWDNLKSLFDFCYGQYYSEKESIGHSLKEGDSLKIIVFYPKTCPQLKEIPFTLYMWDKTGNYWKQEAVNFPGDHSDSETISGEEYFLNANEGIQKKYELIRLYFENYKNLPFNYQKSCIYLESLKNNLWAKENEFRDFKQKVKSGEVLLHKNIDI